MIVQVVSVLLLACSTVAAARTVTLPLSPPAEGPAPRVVDIRLESLAQRISAEGFPRVLAGSGEVSEVWVEDVDQSGTPTPPDNLLIVLPQPLPTALTFDFDDPNRAAPLVAAQPIDAEPFTHTGETYTAVVSNRGGPLVSLKTITGRELLAAPIQYRLYSGGFYMTDGSFEAFLPQSAAVGRLFLLASPVRKTLVCRYNLDEVSCQSDQGPLIAGLKGWTAYYFYSDRLAVENRLFETGEGNFVYSLRSDLHFLQPGTLFTEFTVQNRHQEGPSSGRFHAQEPGWDGEIANLPDWLCLQGPEARLGLVLESPGWQSCNAIDGRGPKWGDFLLLNSFADGLCQRMWLTPSPSAETICREVRCIAAPRDCFRQEPSALRTLSAKVNELDQMLRSPAFDGLWTAPAEVQLQTASALGAMAGQCWNVYRPSQTQRLLMEAHRHVDRAREIAERTQHDRWRDPGYANATGQAGFVRGVYWPWFGTADRQEQRAGYAKRIGIDCAHSMDIQAWPDVEAQLTAPSIDAADFQPTIEFLNLLDRNGLKGLLLTMCPMWPKWVTRLPFHGSPNQYQTPPEPLLNSARWVERYVQAVKNHPALAGYVIHNEPVTLSVDRNDPQVREAFTQWLKARYGEIETANRHWRTAYETWDEIVLPDLRSGRLSPPGSVVAATADQKAQYVNRAMAYEMVRFQQDSFVNHLAYLKDTAVQADPARPAFSKLVDGNLVLTYAAEPFKAREVQHDVYGTNVYYGPQAGAVGHGIGNMNFFVAFGVDMEHEATGLPVWCTEFNQGWWKPYRMGLRGEFAVQVWTAFGKGLRGLFPFSWNPGQWALFYGDDAPAPAAEAMAITYAQLSALDDLVAGLSKPEPRIAFYYPRASLYQRDLDNPAHPERSLSTPLNQLRALYESVSLVGGFPVGFLADEDLEPGKLDSLEALILVEAEYLPQTALDHVRRFVERGGRLVTVGPVARFDEFGFAWDGFPAGELQPVLGAEMADQVPSPVSASGKVVWLPPAEAAVPAVAFANPQADASVLATYADGKPAAIEHVFGEGKVLAIGCAAGVATDARPGATAEFLTDWFESQGIRPSAKTVGFFETSRNELAILGLKDARQNDWLLLVNAGNYPVHPTLRWTTPYSPTTIDVLSGQTFSCTASQENTPELTIRLDPYQVALIGKLECTETKP